MRKILSDEFFIFYFIFSLIVLSKTHRHIIFIHIYKTVNQKWEIFKEKKIHQFTQWILALWYPCFFTYCWKNCFIPFFLWIFFSFFSIIFFSAPSCSSNYKHSWSNTLGLSDQHTSYPLYHWSNGQNWFI